MIDQHRTAQASRYVIGTLPDEERRDFEAALRDDSRLQLLVQQLRGTAGASPTASVPKQPSLAGEAEVQSPNDSIAATPAPKTSGWLLWTPWLLTACFAALCVVLISSGRTLRQRTAELAGQIDQTSRELAEIKRQNAMLEIAAAGKSTNYWQRSREAEARWLKNIEQLGQQSAALTNQLLQQLAVTNRELAVARTNLVNLRHANKALEDAVSSLGARDHERFGVVRLIALRPPDDRPARSLGAAFWSPTDQRGVLAVERLPVLPATQGYQLWLTDAKATAPVSGGLLPVKAGGVRVQFTTDARIDTLQRVFVSVESALGAAVPSDTIVLTGN